MFSVLHAIQWADLTRAHRDQLASLARATPAAMAGYAVNVAIAVIAFHGLVPSVELAAWAAVSLAICSFVGIRSVRRGLLKRQSPAPGSESPLRDAKCALLFGLLLGLPWTIMASRWAGVLHGDSELILALGPSTDGTAAIVERLTRDEPRIRVVQNPGMDIPIGLNLAIAAAKHPIIIRVDAHTELAPGYKSAWLHYGGGCETDFPEGEWTGTLSAFQHPCGGGAQGYFEGAADWTHWHTVSTEWTPGRVRFYVDGRLIGQDTRGVADRPLSWVLQNESALEGPGAAPGSSAQLDITWIAAYAYGWK